MLELSPETEALARTIAAERQLSVDVTVRDALRMQFHRLADTEGHRSKGDLASKRAALLSNFAGLLSKTPDHDTRSAKDIMDDLNPL